MAAAGESISAATGRASIAAAALEAIVPLYLLVQVAYVVLTRLATGDGAGGVAILPYTMLVFTALTFLFIGLSGWHRDAHAARVSGVRLPVPTRETLLSGLGSAMMLCAIPMSYSFPSVSIPLMLVLLRGGVLAAAPLVDLLHRRRIHWASWLALLLVAASLLLVLHSHRWGGLPPLAWLIVVLYNAGFMLRLEMMTRLAKRGDPAQTRRYYVEEKVVALPLGFVGLLAIILLGGTSVEGLSGIVHLQWSALLLFAAVAMGIAMAMAALLTSLILLNARENTFCVPLERASSLLAGMMAAWLLHWFWQQNAPTVAEMIGAGLLFGAVALLAIAKRS